jgi:D-alanyl-D-alanine carboxypeptidase/D-alanyl-D-alanine-endopeptidase (penicillin-binding protein 4)
MKYLGDSLPGIKYMITDKGMLLIPTGDPSLLHADYKIQPVIDFLKKQQAPLFISDKNWQTDALGAGWAWSDYNFYYSAERSALPVYGNILTWTQERTDTSNDVQSPFIYSLPEVNWKVRFNPDTTSKRFYVQRQKDENVFMITEGKENKKVQEVPFVTHGIESALVLLKDTIGKEIQHLEEPQTSNLKLQTIFSQKTDSVLKPMMHRSDNFFAEQLLLMVANERFGVLSEDKIIDTLLKSDLKDLPQKPGWADGSGLSRFNLFTPQDFVAILNRMQNEFGMDRLKDVFQTGGEGTLSNYYKKDSGFIYAKTGSLNGVLALSGYLYTNNNKLLLFSVLINNHRGNTTAIRRQVEAFLGQIRKKY